MSRGVLFSVFTALLRPVVHRILDEREAPATAAGTIPAPGEPPSLDSFREMLSRAKKIHRISVAEVSREAGYTPNYASDALRGRYCNKPNPRFTANMADALHRVIRKREAEWNGGGSK